MSTQPVGSAPGGISGRTLQTILAIVVAVIGTAVAFVSVSDSSGGGGVFTGVLLLSASMFALGRLSVSRDSQASGIARPPAYARPSAYAPPVVPAPPHVPAPPSMSPPPSQYPVPQAWPAASSRAAVERPRAPRPSVRQIASRFVGTHAILLLSYLGAFLLIVSALLFLLYGPQDLPGGARLATVASVNGILALAAFACRRRAALRLVAASYTALAALLMPVTFAAAYEFVLRDATPLNGITAVAIAAAACAVTYALLARSLVSRSYASLSLLALATSGVATVIALGAGPEALPAGAAYTLLCWVVARTRDRAFALPAVVAGHIAAGATLGAAIGFAGYYGFAGHAPYFAYLPGSFAAVAAAYAAKQRLHGDDVGDVLAVILTSVAAVVASQTLGYGADGAAATLLITGFATIAVSRIASRARSFAGRVVSAERMRVTWCALAAAELLAVAMCPISRPVMQLVLLPVTAIGGALIAYRLRTVWPLAVGLAAVILQVVVEKQEQQVLPPAPPYIAATLITLVVTCAVYAAVRRLAWLVPFALTLLVTSELAGGSALGWNANEFAVAVIALAGVTTVLAQRLVLPLRLLHDALARARMQHVMGGIAASTAVIASLFTISDPVLQTAVLGGAVLCGLALALGSRAPLWLATGAVALAAQAAATAQGIAGQAPPYVPSTLGLLLVASAIDGVVRRDRRVALPWAVLLFVATATAGSTLRWQADTYAYALAGVTLLSAAAAVLLPTRLAGISAPLAHGLDNAGAWITVAAAFGTAGFVTTGAVAPYVALGAAAIVGGTLALATRSAWWLFTGVIAVLIEASVHAPAIAAAGALPWYVAAGLGGVLVTTVAVAVRWRDRALLLPANLCLTAVALTANSAAALGATGYAIELVATAYLTVAMATFVRTSRLALVLQLGAAARLVVGIAIIMPSQWGEAGLVASAVACAAWIAASSRRGEWTYLVASLLAWAWYWGAAAAGTISDPTSAMDAFSPLPFVYLGAGLALARLVPRRDAWRWLVAPAAFGLATALAVNSIAVGAADWKLLAWSLFAEGVIAYGFARALRLAVLVPVAAASAAGSAITLLLAVHAPLVAYPLAIAAVAWVTRTLDLVAPRRDGGTLWPAAHRWSAIGVAVLAIATPIVNIAFASSGNGATMSELAASLSLAVLVATGVSSNIVRDRCAAAVIAALALEWLPVFFGVHEAQAFVVLPAAVLAACGVLALHDGRVSLDRVSAYALIATGTGAALLTTLVEMAGAGETSVYTAWLLIEGIVCVTVAIALRVRLLAVIGGAAVASAALRALITAFANVPLYAVFGVVAVLLMVLATVLATQRARLHDARESLREAWGTWD